MKNISEKDLYHFVFHPDSLSEDKKKIITDNLAKYKNELELLWDFKSELDKEVPSDVIEKIKDKISNQTFSETITLNLVIQEDETDYLTLAAGSGNNVDQVESLSFSDEDDKFLGKVVSDTNANHIYIFPKTDFTPDELDITLLPSKDNFTINTADMPYKIEPRQKINKIQLKLKN